MSSPSSPALQELYQLDISSPNFGDMLCNALHKREYEQCVPIIGDGDLAWLVGYLDKSLNDLERSGTASRKCLRELGRVCGIRGVLPTSYTLSPEDLTISSDPFGAGGYGDVYEGTLNRSKVCVKRVRVYTQDDQRRAKKVFCQEAVVWKYLEHPNVISLLGVTITPPQLISNWMSGGDLLQYTKEHPGADRLSLISDVARGLCYLHSCNIIHGDLKGRNVLVDDSGRARVADFGLSTVIRNVDSIPTASRQHGHTVRWSAPEILNDEGNSKETDIFSFAMVMIEVFTGAVPFSSVSSFMVIQLITRGERPPRPTHPTFTEDLWELVQRCWDKGPDLRPGVQEILQTLTESENPAWKRLIDTAPNTNERISLITAIFSNHDQVEMVGNLNGNDAQRFLDVTHEVLDNLSPPIRRKCISTLYDICDRQALLPRSLEIPLPRDPNDPPLYHGGVADIWKGLYDGQEVAVKALRVYSVSELHVLRRRFCREVMTWKALRHPNVLPLLGVTISETRFVMVSGWMENGNIRMFVKAHPDANRLGLLSDATRGLIYTHGQGIIHGNIEAANILIGNDGHAYLAGFGPFTAPLEWSTTTSLTMECETIRWMSPELLNPGKFGFKKTRPTKESDCYSLGMVIYEILSRQTPFGRCTTSAAIWKVLDGERPERPGGDEGRLFTDAIWDMLEHCWKPHPRDRIKVKEVLLGLGGDVEADDQPDDGTGDLDPVTLDNNNCPPHSSHNLTPIPETSPRPVTNPLISPPDGQHQPTPQPPTTLKGGQGVTNWPWVRSIRKSLTRKPPGLGKPRPENVFRRGGPRET